MAIKEWIITQLSKLTKNKITEESLFSEIGIDSLDLVEHVSDLEQHFDIEISDEELLNIKKVNNIIVLIEQKSK